jgi:site-specific DNA recombinase
MTQQTDLHDTNTVTPKRCAIYARYSSEMQRESSVDDQIRKCREYAARQGWVVVEGYVRYDQAISGAMFEQRTALQSLIANAEQKPLPFDLLLVDSTSRLARNAEDQLFTIRTLKFHRVHVVAVSQGLDSGHASARISFAVHGIMDEQYLEDLGNNVRRGQEGCVEGDKYIAGGRCYGYKNVPDEDPTRIGDYGRPFVRGVTRIVNIEEKHIVERIFQMYAEGSSFDKIAQALRADRVPAPRPPRKNSVRGWSPDGIGEMLRNPIYIGQYVWKRTTSARDPKTRQMVTRPVPESEWVRSYREDWRIISEDVWNRVQARRALRRHIGIRKLGGLERTKRSEKYLFSGLLYCGVCGGTIRIIDTDSETVRYGCGTWRDKGACTNATRIRRDRLEEQMLAWLTRDLLQSNRIEDAVTSLCASVQTKLAERQAEAKKNAVNAPALRKELAEKKLEAWNLTDFIAASGRQCSATIQVRLEAADARIKQIEELLPHASEPDPVVTFGPDDIEKYLVSKLHDLQVVLTSEPVTGKEMLRRHISRVILTPGLVDARRVLYVSVEFELTSGGANSDVLLTGSMDAFSQQYGFSTITVSGLTLDTSRVRRKPEPAKQEAENGGATPISLTPGAEANDPTQASDSGREEIHA